MRIAIFTTSIVSLLTAIHLVYGEYADTCRMILMACAVGVALAGCSTVETRNAAYVDNCKRYGFKAGTSEHANCVMRQDMEHKRNVAAAINSNTTTSCHTFGNTTRCDSY